MKLGWIGTGVMGKRMIQRLLDAGHTVYAFNRTYEKMSDMNHPNLFKCKNVEDVVVDTQVIFTMVSMPSDVKEVYLNETKGLLFLAKNNQVCIDMTTSDPELAVVLANNASKIPVLDAPVSGGEIGAEKGTLSIMVGGNEQVFNSVLPLLEVLGNNINYFGQAGNGQHAKLANQILVALNTTTTAEIIDYCHDNKVNTKTCLDIITNLSSSNWQNQNNGYKIMDNNFEPGFFIKHFIKDLNLIRQNSYKNLYGTNQIFKMYENFVTLNSKNYNLGTQAIYKYYRKNKGEY